MIDVVMMSSAVFVLLFLRRGGRSRRLWVVWIGGRLAFERRNFVSWVLVERVPGGFIGTKVDYCRSGNSS